MRDEPIEQLAVEPPSPEVWFQWHAAGVRSMQEAARWVLGVVAAGLLTIVQLPGIGRYGPADRPFVLIIVAAGIVVVSMALMIKSVLTFQPRGDMWRDVQRLNELDLAYVQQWGLMQGYTDSHARFAAISERKNLLNVAVRKSVAAERRPDRMQAAGVARELRTELARASWDEHHAAALLSHRDVAERFRRAQRLMLVYGVAALLGMFMLTWAANPPNPVDPRFSSATVPTSAVS